MAASMAVIAVSSNQVIALWVAGSNGAYGHCFLADVQVQEAFNFTFKLVQFIAAFFKTANQHHLAVPI